MARSLIASDAFASMANFTQVNPNWGNVTAASGTITGSFSGSDAAGEVQAAVWSGSGTFSNDQYASLAIVGLAFLGSSDGIGVIVRSSTDTNGSRDYYQVFIAADSAGPNYTTIFSKVVNGTRTQLHSASSAWANGDRVELEAEGTSIRVCKNGTALGGSFTQTDASLSTGKPGVCASGVTVTADDWEGGDITGATNDAGEPSGVAGTSAVGGLGGYGTYFARAPRTNPTVTG